MLMRIKVLISELMVQQLWVHVPDSTYMLRFGGNCTSNNRVVKDNELRWDIPRHGQQNENNLLSLFEIPWKLSGSTEFEEGCDCKNWRYLS